MYVTGSDIIGVIDSSILALMAQFQNLLMFKLASRRASFWGQYYFYGTLTIPLMP